MLSFVRWTHYSIPPIVKSVQSRRFSTQTDPNGCTKLLCSALLYATLPYKASFLPPHHSTQTFHQIVERESMMEQRKNAAVVLPNSCTEEDKAVQSPVGSPIHSQVRKIKEESEETIADWSPTQPKLRRALRDINRQRSRSPLGLTGRPISVGES